MRILVSAFACCPDRSAEDCVGWNWINQISGDHEVWVMTDAVRQREIEAHLRIHPVANVHWVFHDTPFWLRRFTSLGLGAYYLYYVAWQFGAYRRARQLHRDVHFDATHHITYMQYWTGSYMSRLPVPFYWGPVGGGEVAPRAFYRSFGFFGLLHEGFRDFARFIAHLTPLGRHNARNATIALATTEETGRRIRKLGARNVRVMQAIRLTGSEFERLKDTPVRDESNLRVLSAGRILHWKGFYLSIRSFALHLKQHPDSEFWIAGEGSDKKRCQRIAESFGIHDRIRWCGHVQRDQIYELLAQCDVLLHPSLHESGGLICLEAMAAGRPVICFDLGGPGVTVTAETGIKVPAISPERSVIELATALSRLAAEKELCHSLGKAARKHVRDNFTWSPASSAAGQLYLEAL